MTSCQPGPGIAREGVAFLFAFCRKSSLVPRSRRRPSSRADQAAFISEPCLCVFPGVEGMRGSMKERGSVSVLGDAGPALGVGIPSPVAAGALGDDRAEASASPSHRYSLCVHNAYIRCARVSGYVQTGFVLASPVSQEIRTIAGVRGTGRSMQENVSSPFTSTTAKRPVTWEDIRSRAFCLPRRIAYASHGVGSRAASAPPGRQL